MDTTVLYSVITALWVVTVTLIGIVYSDMKGKLKNIDSTTAKHEQRIQRIEDVQGNKIAELIHRFDKVEESLKELSLQIHKEKNVESAMTGILTGILRHLESTDKSQIKLLEFLESNQRERA